MRIASLRSLLLLVCPALLAAQRGQIVGVVVGAGGEPLGYSIVGLPTLDREMFSSDSGAFRFTDLSAGAIPLRVKRLGYIPFDTVVTVSGGIDTVRVELRRVAARLTSIDVRVHPPCRNPGPPRADADTNLAIVFTQLKMNAEQYRFLAKQYPFQYVLQVKLSSRLRKDGSIREDRTEYQTVDAAVRWEYKPGKVVTRRRGDWFFQIPTMADLADKGFLQQHCFHFLGTRRVGDDDLLRVDLVAAESIKEPDVDGEIYIDPDTYQIKRTVLRLTRPTLRLVELTDLEVVTDFTEILPSISIIAGVESIQRMGPAGKTDYDAAFEQQLLVGYQFTKGKPGQDPRKR